MNLAKFRAQYGGLPNLTDREIVEYVVQQQGYTPENTPNYEEIIQNSLGYDRSTGEIIGDTATQLGQGVVRIGSNLASGFGAWDNPVRRGLDATSDWLGDRFYSEGLQNQQAGREIYSNIRDREAEARGLRGPDRLAYDAQTALENYANAPGTLGADIFMNAPQLLVGGLAGRAGAAVGRGLGLGQRGAAVTGTAAGGGTAGFMQGADIGAQTYDEALRAIMARNDTEAGLTADTIVVTPQGSSVRPGNARTDLQLATDEERAEATALANQAALKSGALTAATSLVPGSLERSMIPGLGTSTTRLGSMARVGGVETATNIVDEGYGQLASGQAVAEVDPARDPWAGVGEVAVQGGAAGGPAGVMGGMVAPLRPRNVPRTEEGDLDLTADPTPEGELNIQFDERGQPILDFESLPAGEYHIGRGFIVSKSTPDGGVVVWQDPNYGAPPPADAGGPGGPGGGLRVPDPNNLDRPTWQRQGLDPLNERPVGPPAPPPAGPTFIDLAQPDRPQEPATFVDLANQRPTPPLPLDPYTEWEQQAAQQPQPTPEQPLALPYNPTMYSDPSGTTQVGQMPSEQEVAQRRYPILPADQNPDDTDGPDDTSGGGTPATSEAVRQAVEDAEARIDRGRLLREIAAIRRSYVRKDGEVSGNAPQSVKDIVEAGDPLEAIRELHQGGAHRGNRDEFLDDLHKRLTGGPNGMTVIEWRERQNLPQSTRPADPTATVNQAGFVTEPIEQVRAQVQAVKEGVLGSVVIPPEQADQVDLTGLAKTTVTDPDTSESAVVASRNRATVQRAAARAQEVGLQQALGEMQNRVEPEATTQPRGDEVVVQQVDNGTGQVLDEEAVSPDQINQVNPIPGTTARVTTPEAVIEQRQEPAPKPNKPARPKKSYANADTDELIGIALSPDTKSDAVLDAVESELLKRWDGGNARAARYFREGYTNATRDNRIKALREKASADIAKMFNSSKARPASEVRGKPLTVQQVQAIVDSLGRANPNIRDIQVMQRPEDAGLEFDEGLSVSGVTLPDGTIILFADGITNRMDALNTIFHELFHKGVTATPRYQEALRDIAERDPWIRAQAANWKLTPDGRRHARREDLTPEQYDALAVEEALARVSERLQGGENIGSRQTAVRGLVKWLAAKADAWGMADLARRLRRMTYTEAEQFVLDTLNADTTTPPPGGPRGGEPVRARAADAAAPAPGKTGAQLTSQSKLLNPFSKAFKTATAYAGAQLTGRDIDPSVLTLASPSMIQEQLGHKLPAFKQWFDTVLERAAHARKLANKADVVAQKWQKLGKRDAGALGEIMLEATSLELSLDNTSADYLNSLSADERAAHTRLRSRLAALPEAARSVRAEALAVLQEQFKISRDGLIHLAEHTIRDPATRAERIRQLKEGMGQLKGDYFPLSRFGDNVVIGHGAAKDGRDTISFHESTYAAEAERDRLRRETGKNVTITKTSDPNVREGASTNFVNQIYQLLNETEMDAGTKDVLGDAIQQLYLKSMPEFSGAKHMLRRENIEGYSKDAIRGFADAVSRGARYAARLQYGPAMHAALEAAAAQSRSSEQRTASLVIGTKGDEVRTQVVATGTDRLKAAEKLMADGFEVEWANVTPENARETLASKVPGITDQRIGELTKDIEQTIGRTEAGVEDLRVAKELHNYIVRRNAEDKDHRQGRREKLMHKLGQGGFLWFLGFTPTYWLMNALQNHLVMQPHLGGKYGVVKSQTEMLKAMGWFFNVRMGKLLRPGSEPFTIEWLRKNAPKGVSKNELDMLQWLEDRGGIDFTRMRDLSQVAEDSTGQWSKWMSRAAAGAHHTEVFNRVVGALTAYRLAIKSDANITHERAMEMAENDVRLAHLDYSPENTANLMRGPYAGRILMFQKYRQGMLYWWVKQVADSVKGESRADRLKAGKAMALMAASHLMAAGVRGLPFVGAFQTVASLLNAAFGDDDEPFDVENWVRDAAEGAFGEGTGRLLTQGVFDAMGLNIGQRLGQHDLIPFSDWSQATKFERDGADKVRAYLFDALGPLGSVAMGAGDAMDAAGRGDWVSAGASITPKFVSDVLKSWDLHDKGLRDRRGNVIAQRELFDGIDKIVLAAGTQPTAIADVRRARGVLRGIERHYSERSAALTKSFVTSLLNKDDTGVQEAIAKIVEYNRKVATKFPEQAINGRRLDSAVKAEVQKQVINAATGGTADSRRHLIMLLRMSEMVPQPGQELGLPPLPGIND